MRVPSIILATLFGCLVALPAEAGGSERRENRIEKRFDKQLERIEKGHRKNLLTRREGRALERRGERIEELYDRARRDGRVGRREARKLNRHLDAWRSDIRRFNHNSRTARGFDPWRRDPWRGDDWGRADRGRDDWRGGRHPHWSWGR